MCPFVAKESPSAQTKVRRAWWSTSRKKYCGNVSFRYWGNDPLRHGHHNIIESQDHSQYITIYPVISSELSWVANSHWKKRMNSTTGRKKPIVLVLLLNRLIFQPDTAINMNQMGVSAHIYVSPLRLVRPGRPLADKPSSTPSSPFPSPAQVSWWMFYLHAMTSRHLQEKETQQSVNTSGWWMTVALHGETDSRAVKTPVEL